MGLETGAIIALGAMAASTAAAGALSYVSQKSANNTNVKLQNETNKLNYQMFQEQLGFTERMQDKQNAYNTPVAQRQRYEQAGINPYLAMTNINSGNAELASTPSANPAQAARVQPNTGLANLLQGLGQVPSQAYQIQQMSEQVNAQREAVKAARTENLFRAADRAADINKKVAEQQKLLSDSTLNEDKRQEIMANVRKLKFESSVIETQAELDRRTLNARTRKEENMADLIFEQKREQAAKAAYQEIYNDFFPKLGQQQLSLLSAQTYQAAKAGELSSNMSETEKAKKIGQIISNGISANEYTLSQFNLSESELEAMRKGDVSKLRNKSLLFRAFDDILDYTVDKAGAAIGFVAGRATAGKKPVKVAGFR